MLVMRVVPWNERTLPFGRSTEELPLLAERLLGTPARLWQLTAQADREQLSLRRSGTWSVMEHIGHMLLLDDHMEQRLDDFSAKRPQLSTIDLSGQNAQLEGHRRRELGDLLEEFRLRRTGLVQGLLALDPEALRHSAQHPCRSMNMRPVDMATFLAEHDDHHLALVRGLLDGRRLSAGS
jgi:hypothetical protein